MSVISVGATCVTNSCRKDVVRQQRGSKYAATRWRDGGCWAAAVSLYYPIRGGFRATSGAGRRGARVRARAPRFAAAARQ